MSVPARMTMTAGAAGACAKLAATNAMVEIAASMYRIRTSWELGGHHTSSNAKTENWKPRTGNRELETKNRKPRTRNQELATVSCRKNSSQFLVASSQQGPSCAVQLATVASASISISISGE